jgi:putative tryptophan/tyrosine transport system substrate-binding protein
MNRRAFVLELTGGLIAAPLAVRAQPAGKVFRIGFLREGELPLPKSFWNAMQEEGWIEGRNLLVEQRFARSADQLLASAKELVQLRVDLILTDGTPATRAARAASGNIPILFSIAADPVQQKFVASLARPGANITGFTFGSYGDKQLQILKETIPSMRRVAYPDPEPSAGFARAAASLGVQVQAIPARGPEDLESFFAAARSSGADAVVFSNFSWTGSREKRIAAEALRNSVPLIGTWREFAAAGALLAYGPDPTAHWPRLAAPADRILRGAKPADLPVEQPTVFRLVVNLGTARALGVAIPPLIRQRADEVIE